MTQEEAQQKLYNNTQAQSSSNKSSFYETEFEIWPGRAILVFTICFKVTVSLDYTTLTLLDLAC